MTLRVVRQFRAASPPFSSWEAARSRSSTVLFIFSVLIFTFSIAKYLSYFIIIIKWLPPASG
jgi:hypothetical protein